MTQFFLFLLFRNSNHPFCPGAFASYKRASVVYIRWRAKINTTRHITLRVFCSYTQIRHGQKNSRFKRLNRFVAFSSHSRYQRIRYDRSLVRKVHGLAPCASTVHLIILVLDDMTNYRLLRIENRTHRAPLMIFICNGLFTPDFLHHLSSFLDLMRSLFWVFHEISRRTRSVLIHTLQKCYIRITN